MKWLFVLYCFPHLYCKSIICRFWECLRSRQLGKTYIITGEACTIWLRWTISHFFPRIRQKYRLAEPHWYQLIAMLHDDSAHHPVQDLICLLHKKHFVSDNLCSPSSLVRYCWWAKASKATATGSPTTFQRPCIYEAGIFNPAIAYFNKYFFSVTPWFVVQS